MKYSFDFALTTYCQARCRSCARTNENTGEKEDWLKLQHMDLEVFEKRLSSFSKGINRIQFCGEFGDPMMHPQIRQFIDTSLKYTNTVHINTNGGLRRPEFYRELHKAHRQPDLDVPTKKVHIKFGIDGTDHDTNWLYREGVDWQRAMDNMTAWFENEGHGKWDFLLFEWNWHQIPKAVEIAKQINAPLEFKFNNRHHGLISPESKRLALQLLEEHYEEM